MRAASQASKAADWLLAFLPESDEADDGDNDGVDTGVAQIDRRAA